MLNVEDETFDEIVSQNNSDLPTINGTPDNMNTQKSLSLSEDAPISEEQNESSTQQSRSEKDEVNNVTPEKVTPTDNAQVEEGDKQDSSTSKSLKSLSVSDSEVS